MSDKLLSPSSLQEDIFETIEILGKKAIQLEAVSEESWGPSCIGFYTSDWNSIFGLFESEDFLTWRLDRNDFTMKESNYCLAGTVIYDAQELQGCLKRIQEIFQKQTSGTPSDGCLALIVTRDSSQEFNDKLREIFRGLEKEKDEECVKFFENIRIMPLPDLMKAKERKEMNESKVLSKTPILSKKIEKWGRSEKKNVLADFWKKKYGELENEHLQLCEELKKSQNEKKELEFRGKTLQRKIAHYQVLEEERQLEDNQEDEVNDGFEY